MIGCVPNTARRFAYCSALALCLGLLTCVGNSQTPAPRQETCNDAQVIAIQGGWVANPGSRSIVNWSCVTAREEISLAPDSTKGEITVIYHRGAKPPHTVRCDSRAQCRNAYQVEASPTQADLPKSTVDQILDFFFSIFTGEESQPVPGILRGEALRPRPTLACSDGLDVRVENVLKPGFYNLQVAALNQQAEHVTWQAGSTADNQAHVGSLLGSFKKAKSNRDTSSSLLVMSHPLEGPALYEVETWPIGSSSPHASVWLLIAPDSLCSPVKYSYQQAVALTETWPSDTPDAAIQNFRLRYLQGLAIYPDKAPKDMTLDVKDKTPR
jgi:hypothetical protein